MCEATRKGARGPGSHCEDDLTKKPVWWGSRSAPGVRPASEREQADRRLAWFRETKIVPVAGGEVCVDEMIQMLPGGLEVPPAGLAASV